MLTKKVTKVKKSLLDAESHSSSSSRALYWNLIGDGATNSLSKQPEEYSYEVIDADDINPTMDGRTDNNESIPPPCHEVVFALPKAGQPEAKDEQPPPSSFSVKSSLTNDNTDIVETASGNVLNCKDMKQNSTTINQPNDKTNSESDKNHATKCSSAKSSAFPAERCTKWMIFIVLLGCGLYFMTEWGTEISDLGILNVKISTSIDHPQPDNAIVESNFTVYQQESQMTGFTNHCKEACNFTKTMNVPEFLQKELSSPLAYHDDHHHHRTNNNNNNNDENDDMMICLNLQGWIDQWKRFYHACQMILLFSLFVWAGWTTSRRQNSTPPTTKEPTPPAATTTTTMDVVMLNPVPVPPKQEFHNVILPKFEDFYDLSSYYNFKVVELREMLRFRKLPTSGKKAILVQRLAKVYAAELETLTIRELRPMLKRQKLRVSGRKAELIRRLVEAGVSKN